MAAPPEFMTFVLSSEQRNLDGSASALLPPLDTARYRVARPAFNSSAMAAMAAQAHEQRKVCMFDVSTGAIEITNSRDTDRGRLVAQLYHGMQHNETMKSQLFQVVMQKSLADRTELARSTLARFHTNKQRAMFSRKVLPDVVSRHRANLLKHLEIERCFGDLSKDTSELAAVRIASAAVDQMLFLEAQKVADAQLKQQRSLVLPDAVKPVDVLEMRIDAYRRQHVPFPPRRIVE